MELDKVLRRFYARAKDCELYSRSSLLTIRNAIERFLKDPPHNRGIKITKGEAFQLSNKMLNSKIKVQKKDRKENIKHKPAIPPGDLRKLSASGVIRGGTPLGLLRNVWFNTSLYWCRRGREGQRELRADSFVFEVDEDCRPYAHMNVDDATKNHPGRIVGVQSSQKFGRMYQTSSDPSLDGLSCLKKYISKRNVSCEAFLQYAKRKGAEESDDVWYENRPLGLNKLQRMMKDIIQSFCESHGHHLMVRCPDILPSHNEYIRSPQQGQHQGLQHEAFVKSTSPVFRCLVRGVFLAKHFKPIVTG